MIDLAIFVFLAAGFVVILVALYRWMRNEV